MIKIHNPKLRRILKESGWSPGRHVPHIVEEYMSELGNAWIDQAAPFLESFGGLSIYHSSLWIYPEGLSRLLKFKPMLEQVAGEDCCPLCLANYQGDDSTLWIDVSSRYYAVDSEGVAYLADDVESTFAVLFLGERPKANPAVSINS